MNPAFAVAAATAAFADRLHALLGEAVPGARVTMLNPSEASLRGGDPIVNLYLFRTVRDGPSSNRDLPTRAPDGTPRANPTLVLQLDYMISFFGEDARLDPQRLLGLVAGGLYAEPTIEAASLRASVAATPWLNTGGELPAGERLRIAPMNLPPDGMARMWYDLVHTPYQLSAFYTVVPVPLTVPLTVIPVLPVRRIGLEVVAGGIIPVRELVNAAAPTLPLSAGGVMAIRMNDPGRPGLGVELDGQAAPDVKAGFDAAGFAALLVALAPAGTGAGPLRVRVVERRAGQLIAQSAALEAGILPGFAVAPAIDSAGRLVATLAHDVAADAGATFILYATAGSAGPSLRLAATAAGRQLSADLAGVTAGRYLVAAEIGGLASVLDYEDGRYSGPLVSVP